MKHDEIIQKVRDILNEHGGDNALSITTDRVLLDEYIECAIPDAVIILAQRGVRVNPKTQETRNPKTQETRNPETQETGNPETQNTGNAVVEEPGNDIKLPADFVSLIYVKLGQWKRKVTRVTEVGSPEYNMAMNVYTAPGVNTPMCYKEGDTLICLPDEPVKSDDTPAVESVDTFIMEYNAEYKQPTDANAVALTASPKEAAAVCYMTAALVMGMFGDDLGKQRLSDISTNMLQ